MNIEQPIEISVPTEKRYLWAIREVVGVAARLMGFDSVDVYKIKMAVDEACTNVIVHGYPDSPTGRRPAQEVRVRVHLNPERIVVVVADSAGRFSPLENGHVFLEDYLDRDEGPGLGILVMESFMDKVEHHFEPEKGNELRLTKYLPQARPTSVV